MRFRSAVLGLLLAVMPLAGAEPAPVAVPGNEVDLVVVKAYCYRPHEPEYPAQQVGGTAGKSAGTNDISCQLGDTVRVEFANLGEWVKASPEKHDPGRLVIALNGHLLEGTRANVMVVGDNALSFDMMAPEGADEDSEANKKAWRAILRAHRSPTWLTLSVGLKGGQTYYGHVPLRFKLYPRLAPLVFVLMGVLALGVVVLARKMSMTTARPPASRPGTASCGSRWTQTSLSAIGAVSFGNGLAAVL